MLQDLSYPIGKYIPQSFSQPLLQEWLLDIENLPSQLEYAITNLDEAQLETPYRPGGWTVKQLVHHVADSHMNAYIRFKLALTEDNPVIKSYNQDAWAKLKDTENLPVNISLTLLHALHKRWHEVLVHMQEEDWNKTVYHPEYKKEMTLWYLLGMYAWHSKHHVAHVKALREREGW